MHVLAVAMLDIEFFSKHMIDKWNETEFGDTVTYTGTLTLIYI